MLNIKKLLLLFFMGSFLFSCGSDDNGDIGNDDDQGPVPDPVYLVSRMVRTSGGSTTFNYTYDSNNVLLSIDADTFRYVYENDGANITNEIFLTTAGMELSRSNYIYDSDGQLDYYIFIPETGVNAYVDLIFSADGQLLERRLYSSQEDLDNEEGAYRTIRYVYNDSSSNYFDYIESITTGCQTRYNYAYSDTPNTFFFGEAVERIKYAATLNIGFEFLSDSIVTEVTEVDCITGTELYTYEVYTHSTNSEDLVTQVNLDRFDANGTVIFSENKSIQYTEAN